MEKFRVVTKTGFSETSAYSGDSTIDMVEKNYKSIFSRAGVGGAAGYTLASVEVIPHNASNQTGARMVVRAFAHKKLNSGVGTEATEYRFDLPDSHDVSSRHVFNLS